MFKIILLLLLLIPNIASAHVKWFAKPGLPERTYQLSDPWVIAWILISLGLVLIGIFLEKKLHTPKILDRIKSKYSEYIPAIANIGLGLSLILFSINGFIFAPNQPTLNIYLITLQFFIGIIILLGFFQRLGAMLLILLYLLIPPFFGPVEALDSIEMLGFALFSLLATRAKWSLHDPKWLSNVFTQFSSYGIPLLRVFTGINLVILGFSEKILSPSLTNNFLSQFNWNFMQNIGFTNFTNYWFAFSAGAVEALFGIFLILGLITRLTTICLALFLLSTLILLGPIELLGHLPHFSLAVVLVIFGSGDKYKFVK